MKPAVAMALALPAVACAEDAAAPPPAADVADIVRADELPGADEPGLPSDAAGPDLAEPELPSADGAEEEAVEEPPDLCMLPDELSEATCANPATVLSFSERPAPLAFGKTGQGGLLAMSTSDGIELRWIDAGGQPSEAISLPVEGELSGLATASSDEATFVFYSTGRLDEDGPAGTALYLVEIDPAAGPGTPVPLQDGFELKAGAIPTIVGPRMWGITDEEVNGVVYRMVSMMLLEHDGSIRNAHTVRTLASFGYYRIHASGARAFNLYVEQPDGVVAYYDQSVYLLACGNPGLPVDAVDEPDHMLGSAFFQQTAIWLTRRTGTCGGASDGQLVFHDTGPGTSERHDLGLSFTDVVAVGVRQANGRGVLVDATDRGMIAWPFDVGQRAIALPVQLDPRTDVPDRLHLTSGAQGWLALRGDSGPDGGYELTIGRLCLDQSN